MAEDCNHDSSQAAVPRPLGFIQAECRSCKDREVVCQDWCLPGKTEVQGTEDANSRQVIEGCLWMQAGKRMCREGREGRWEGAGRESKQRRTAICVPSGVCEFPSCISSDWYMFVIQWVVE